MKKGIFNLIIRFFFISIVMLTISCQSNNDELESRYVNRNNAEEYLELYKDGTFFLMEYGGEFTGEWEAIDNKFHFTFTDTNIPGIGHPTSTVRINGDTLRDMEGKTWVLEQ